MLYVTWYYMKRRASIDEWRELKKIAHILTVESKNRLISPNGGFNSKPLINDSVISFKTLNILKDESLFFQRIIKKKDKDKTLFESKGAFQCAATTNVIHNQTMAAFLILTARTIPRYISIEYQGTFNRKKELERGGTTWTEGLKLANWVWEIYASKRLQEELEYEGIFSNRETITKKRREGYSDTRILRRIHRKKANSLLRSRKVKLNEYCVVEKETKEEE